jgi:hypothetical protein
MRDLESRLDAVTLSCFHQLSALLSTPVFVCLAEMHGELIFNAAHTTVSISKSLCGAQYHARTKQMDFFKFMEF